MGLLDAFSNMGNLSPDQTQGLLAAASQILQNSGPRSQTSFSQALGMGTDAYAGTMDALKRRKMQEDQAKMAMQMHGLQVQDMQGNLADKQRTRDMQAKIRSALAGNDTGSAQPSAPQAAGGTAAAMPGGSMFPRVSGSYLMPSAPAAPQQAAPAQSGGDSNQMLMDRLAREAGIRAQYGDDAGANALYEHIAKLRDEYATDFRVATGDDGKLHNYLVSKTGKLKDTGLGVKPNMVELGLGNRKQFIDTNTVMPGQQFMMGQSPDSAASNGLGWARLKNDIAQQGRPQFNAEVGGFISPPNAGAPNGTLTPLAGYTKPQKPLTEDQGKATGWLVQAENAFGNMKKALVKNPTAAHPGINDAIAAVPSFGIGESIANTMRTPARQQFMQGSSSLSEALLRAATGAGVNKDEALQKVRELTPVFGEASETTQQKMDAIPLYIESLKVRAGPGAAQAKSIGAGSTSDLHAQADAILRGGQ